ncbi:plasminogen-binding N-terminal domain-containing protein [uncultured Helicobacter sp.]|uniref:plasminogen-binding N-terminal domain-containing protein n=1 Tax=uncultured Helicobacter sp. TaxID=175537 RepID=UPI002636DEF7|nr:plasminogen-binding N-terminal domain-containing protein [uncultured Helicobacter sp.]
MRLILGLLCCMGLAYGIDTSPASTHITEVSSKEVIFPAKNLKVGQSGVILTRKDSYNVIIADVQITRIKNNVASADYTAFDSIKQKYLPTPIAKPRQGDVVLFNGFYNKAIAIAPDQESYNKILSTPSQTQFAHIDLFSAFLAKDGINDPKQKHFQAFCKAYSIGLVYIFASNGINVLDCQSFAILEEIPMQKPQLTQTQAPFFSRIANIDTGSLASKLRSKKSRQFFSYYDGLLSQSLKKFHSTDKE